MGLMGTERSDVTNDKLFSHICFLVPSEHGVDCLGEFSATLFIDARTRQSLKI
jgi:hypothetical protein